MKYYVKLESGYVVLRTSFETRNESSVSAQLLLCFPFVFLPRE